MGGVWLVVVVVMVVMDIFVTEVWMQYKFLFTYPQKKFLLFVTAFCWSPGQVECIILF